LFLCDCQGGVMGHKTSLYRLGAYLKLLRIAFLALVLRETYRLFKD